MPEAPEANGDQGWLRVGRVSGAYGIKGWVRVRTYTESPEGFLALEGLHLEAPGAGAGGAGERRPVDLAAARVQGKGIVAHIAGIEDRTQAERLRGQTFWIPAQQLPTLAAGDYYWRDLIGLAVYSDHEGGSVLLGEVDHLIETGANDVLVLRPCPGSVDDRERLVPYLPGAVIAAVEPAANRIRVHWHPDD